MTIEKLHEIFSQHYLVDTDTRNIRKNTLFFALKGENFNGNKFAEEALKKGALYSIVDEEEYQTSSNIILVDNVLETLQKLATFHRNHLGTTIISLTGSNGKTTTKELINSVLCTKFLTTATKGNLNNHIGVPLTLLSMTPKTEIGIVEMGANHLNEIAFLCEIARPNFGYITNFGKAHLEGFGSVEGVIQGKSELYQFLRENAGVAIINPYDQLQINNSQGIKTTSFPSSIKLIEASPYVKISFKEMEIISQLIGSYNYTNIAAAITIGNCFKIDKATIKHAIENYHPTNNRSQVLTKGSNKIILDAYNANPSSMEVALNNFDQYNGVSKKVILGDMFELGDSSKQEHQQIVNLIEAKNFDEIFIIGSNFGLTKTRKASKYESFSDFIKNVNLNDFNNSTILIKGSRGMALERLINLL